MGIINFGIPIREALAVSKILNLNIFVETGTYMGETALKMSQFFKRVYTIEASENLFKISQHNLKNFDNIIAYLGDSRKILNSIIEN
jgi:predicted O-methyltransferase YrrM